MKKILFLILSVCFSACSFSQKGAVNWECRQLSEYELSNFSVLSECYGYIRFFYPNQQTTNFNWTKFLMYSVSKIEKISNDNELKTALLEVFRPICPQISFSTDPMVSGKKLLPPYFVMEYKAIGSLAEIDNSNEYYTEICRLLATVKDSHIQVWNSFTAGFVATYIPYFYPAVSLDFVNDTCFVDFVGKEYENQMKQGDIVWYVLPAGSPQSKAASKKNQYKEPLPVLIEKPLVFLTNGKTISFGETFAEMMKFYKIGSIAGTHTAGCNGDATLLSLPGATFIMTYHKFLNRDGSQHHGIGVLPDVNCEMQLSDIQRNIDTQLEKAKELFQ